MANSREDTILTDCIHCWEEVYYGYKCAKCEQFIPFGCEPWLPEEAEMLASDDADDSAS